MRIKITENQLRVIKSKINEDVNYVLDFEKFCSDKSSDLNRLYSKIGIMNIAEIINHEVKLSGLIDYLWNLENVELRNKRKMAENYVETIEDDEEFSKLDIRINNANLFVIAKIDALNLILESLNKIQNEIKENDLNKVFSDIKPIQI
jgi:lysyl-tRNA synthetase class I